MPVYEYRCPVCLKEESVVLPMAERDSRRVHSCGVVMVRLMSLPSPAVYPVGGKDKVLSTLNQEKGYNFPGGDMHRPRYEQAMAKGLDYVRPLEDRIFTGF